MSVISEFIDDTVGEDATSIGVGGALGGIGAGLLLGAGPLGVAAGILGGAFLGGSFGDDDDDDDVDHERIQELIDQGVSESVATQQAALERALKFGEPFREAGAGALPFLTEQLTAEGLSPLAELEKRERLEAIANQLADVGQFTSSLRTRESGRAVGEVAAGDIQRRLGIAQFLAGTGAGSAGQAAGLTFETGRGVGETQLGGKLGAASLLAGQATPEGLFGPKTSDILQTASIAAPFFL